MNCSKSLQDINDSKQQANILQRQLTEINNRLAHRLPGKALRACFLRNMDQHFGGISLPVSKKRYQQFKILLEAITAALRTHVVLKSAITKIYRINGTPLLSLDDFYEGDILVCCCQYEPFVDVGYNVNQAYMRLLGSLIRMREKFQGLGVEKPSVIDIDYDHCKLPPAILLYIDVKNTIWVNKSSMIFEGYGRARADKRYIVKMVDREYMCLRTKGCYFEIEILRQLQDHNNIIDLIYTVEQFKLIYIVIEYLDCDLFDLLRKNGGVFSESLVKKVMADVSCGLAFIHANQIIHRDLKLDNLLARIDTTSALELCVSTVKISDFGLATYYKGRELYQCCGTPHYMAPELIDFAGYDFSVDLWSLGVTMFYMLCSEVPFGRYAIDNVAVRESIRNDPVEIPSDCIDTISPNAQHLIHSLLVKAPQYRLSAIEVSQHLFLQGDRCNSF